MPGKLIFATVLATHCALALAGDIKGLVTDGQGAALKGVRGDMSLVGPRPPLPAEVAEYDLQDRRRLHVKPGITCIWQVSGRSDIPFEQQVELDVDYIYTQSLATDIKLLLQTVPAVVLGRGAY